MSVLLADAERLRYAPLTMDLYKQMGIVPLKMLIGEHPTQAEIDAVDPMKHVSAETSPCFLYSTTADKTVDSRNVAEFYEALKAAGVPAEMHVFELGQHGTHMGEDAKPDQHELTMVPELIANWMQLHGWIPAPAQELMAQAQGEQMRTVLRAARRTDSTRILRVSGAKWKQMRA